MVIDMDAALPWLAAFCLLLLFGGCAWPRIIVLEDPLTPQEHLNLGVAYEKNNEFDQAIKEYRSAAGNLPIACLYLGNVYFQRKEFDKAEKYYQKAIQKEPGQADAYNNLAWLYYVRGGDLDRAQSLVLKALELRPEKDSVYRDTLDRIRGELEKIGR
jgi:tetratricopeptide (TPR) repeat protein